MLILRDTCRVFFFKHILTCWRTIVAYRCAGAAPVLIGGLGGEAQGAAPSSHVVHVIIGLIHDAGREAGVDTRMAPDHAVGPLTEWHHLENK